MDEVLKELTRERDRLVERADSLLENAIKRLQELRTGVNDAIEGQPYLHNAGHGALFQAAPVDLSVVNAAYDAIERVAHIENVIAWDGSTRQRSRSNTPVGSTINRIYSPYILFPDPP